MLQRMLRAWNLVVYHERGRHGLAASRSATSAPPASPHHPRTPAALLCHGASGQGTSTGETVVTAVKGPSPVNPAIAGCAAGALLGVRQGSITNAGYGCAIFAGLQLMGGFANDFGQIGGH